MATVAAFRKFALALPDVVEGAHMEHPDFRTNGRIFASLHPTEGKAMVKLPPGEQQRLVAALPEMFAPCNGAWGKQGCTWVQLAAVEATQMRDALTSAWQTAQALKPGKPKRR